MEESLWLQLEMLPISQEIGATWWFPLLESLHVLGLTIMLGALLMLDLRLMGLAAMRYSVSSMNRELLPWSISAFAVVVITGIGMFVTRASAHIENPAFIIKMLCMGLAGLNIAWFHFSLLRTIAHWDTAANMPVSVRIAGMASLILWCAVTLAGRWVGHLI